MARLTTGSGKPPIDALERFMKGARDEESKRLDEAANILYTELRAVTTRPGTGRKYRRHKARFTKKGTRLRDKATDFHVASAPGQPPAEDFGNLHRSILISRESDTVRRVSVNATSKSKSGKVTFYPALLEFGTRRMAARPFMSLALANVRPRLAELGVRTKTFGPVNL